jgi:hypothetical protein
MAKKSKRKTSPVAAAQARAEKKPVPKKKPVPLRTSVPMKEKAMATRVTVAGSQRTLLPNSRPAGPVDPSETASLTIRLRSAGDSAALEKRVK